MSLSKHIDPEELIEQAADHPILSLLEHPSGRKAHTYHSGAHAGRYVTEPIPKYKIPERGTGAQATYQVHTRHQSTLAPCESMLTSLASSLVSAAFELGPLSRRQADLEPGLFRPHLDAGGSNQTHDGNDDDQLVRSRRVPGHHGHPCSLRIHARRSLESSDGNGCHHWKTSTSHGGRHHRFVGSNHACVSSSEKTMAASHAIPG